MSKNAEGWIRHNSKQQPVDDHVEVEIRTRGCDYEICEASGFAWNATGENQIMAYRLHKTVDQVEACSKPDPRDSAKRDSDYVCWMRDRITEIDATTSALATERAELVQKLASEGFALIGRAVEPVEDMSDWRNWKVGDLLECKETLYPNLYTPSRRYAIKQTYKDGVHIYDDIGGFSSCKFLDHELSGFKFHSRPSA